MNKLWLYLTILLILTSLVEANQSKSRCERKRSNRKCKKHKTSINQYVKTEWITDYTTVYKDSTLLPSNFPAGITMTAWSTDIVYVPKKSTTPDVTSSTSVILNTVEPSTSSVSTSSFPSPSPTHSRQAHEGLTQPDDWRQQMLDLVNKERTKVGKAAVQLYNKLNQMAQAHTQYQFDIKTMTHNDTKPLGQRATDLGIRWSFLSENVAFGYKSVQDVMQGWINSPGHYHNIIGNANYAGFGVVDNFWSQNFAMVNAV